MSRRISLLSLFESIRGHGTKKSALPNPLHGLNHDASLDLISKQVIEIIQEEWNLDRPISVNEKLSDNLGSDSLTKVELCMRCEEDFQININDEEIEKIETVYDLIHIVAQKNGPAFNGR